MADETKVSVDVDDLELVSNAAIAWLYTHQDHWKFDELAAAVLRLRGGIMGKGFDADGK